MDDTVFVIWFTGLPSSGKSTLAARLIMEILNRKEFRYYIEWLDGDVVRDKLPKTGFSKEARDAHILRMGYTASLLEKHGVGVVASFVSPYRETREAVRKMCINFIEVYVSTSLDECQRRDVKGLYEAARSGTIKNMTGVDDPYEPPEDPELVINTEGRGVDACVWDILNYLRNRFNF